MKIEYRLVLTESAWSRFKVIGTPYLLRLALLSTRLGFIGAAIVALTEFRLLQGADLTTINVTRYAIFAFIALFAIRIFMEFLWRHVAIGEGGIHISHAGWWDTKVNIDAIDTCTVEHVHVYTVVHIRYDQKKEVHLVLHPKNSEQRETIETIAKHWVVQSGIEKLKQ